jgi:hypothetical protein
MLTGTPSEKARKRADRAARRGREDEATRIGWRMAGLGIETVSYVLGGVAIGWGLKLLVVQWGWPESDGWIVGGALLGMASGFSQLIRGGLKLNRQLEAATRRSRDGHAAEDTADSSKSSEDK